MIHGPAERRRFAPNTGRLERLEQQAGEIEDNQPMPPPLISQQPGPPPVETVATILPAQAPTPGDVGVIIEDNCDSLEATRKNACRTFVDNQRQFVFPALEDVSGAHLKQRLDKIIIRFDAPHKELGQTATNNRIGIIQYNPELTTGVLSAQVETHEPYHLLNQSIGVPYLYDYNHVAFMTIEAAIAQAVFVRSGQTLSAVAKEPKTQTDNASYWVSALQAKPSKFSEPGMFNGCPGVATFLLSKTFLKTSSQIRAFLSAVDHDAMLKQSAPADANEHLLKLVLQTTGPSPEERDFVAPYCALPLPETPK